jgi:cell division protein FtsB
MEIIHKAMELSFILNIIVLVCSILVFLSSLRNLCDINKQIKKHERVLKQLEKERQEIEQQLKEL